MSGQNGVIKRETALVISWFDLVVIALLLIGGWIYLHDVRYWSVGYIGDAPYGDAKFWWDGAVQFAQGIFQDNPGKGYRPGYFVLSGLALPVLGSEFQDFFPYFLLTFLIANVLFYLTLRRMFNNFFAICVVCMNVFNPYTAEWVATSTTDATGLLLHLAALSCLLIGINKNLHKFWLALFGFIFALATLTRPLMTPFIGIVLLACLFLTPKTTFKRRVGAVICIAIAFCLPLCLWMGAQKLMINQWTISSNDAGAFYAASDPQIQVWNPTMYDHISKLAAERFHANPNDRLINQTFWQETIQNYIKYSKYHFDRIIPHIMEIASFNPKIALHGSDFWRTSILMILAFGLSLGLLFNRRWLQTIIAFSLGICIYLFPFILGLMTIAGVITALLIPHKQHRLGVFLLSCYWLVGAASLYLVGGTWGPPLTPLLTLNALGYRLGCQLFFFSDLLAAYFIFWLSIWNLKINVANENQFSKWWRLHVIYPLPFAGKFVISLLGMFSMAIISTYVWGGIIIAKRAHAYSTIVGESYPELKPIFDIFKKNTGNDLVILDKLTKQNLDLIFTGATSAFVWNFKGQQRTQMEVHIQNQSRPYKMGNQSIILEVPEKIRAKDWIFRQGAFIIHQTPNNHNEGTLPYYLTAPAVRAFVPLSHDGKYFDIEKIIWFPLVKNATQLDTSGELQCKNAKIIWSYTSGTEQFQRRFYLEPQSNSQALKKASLILNLAKIARPAKLSFFYVWGDVSGVRFASQGFYDIKISNMNENSFYRQLIARHEPYSITDENAMLKKIELDIPANTKAIEVSFNNLLPNTGIWIYEFNLSISDNPQQSKKILGKN